MIRLLALDLDGTLLNSRGEVSDANREAIRAAESAGVLVTIATGRRFRDARPVGLDLGLNAPLITHNGGLVKYADSLETVAASTIDRATARQIVKAGKEFGGDALVSADPHGKGVLLYDSVSDDNIPLQRYVAWAKRLHGDDAENAVIHVADLDDVLDEHDVIHISFSGDCARMDEMIEVLEASLGDAVTLLPTIYPALDFTLIDVLPPGTSKGSGLEKLRAFDNIPVEELMVIGDNFNDLGMLEVAGTPVVMGNADASLLQRPEFYKTLSNDESGVASAIGRFILN